MCAALTTLCNFGKAKATLGRIIRASFNHHHGSPVMTIRSPRYVTALLSAVVTWVTATRARSCGHDPRFSLSTNSRERVISGRSESAIRSGVTDIRVSSRNRRAVSALPCSHSSYHTVASLLTRCSRVRVRDVTACEAALPQTKPEILASARAIGAAPLVDLGDNKKEVHCRLRSWLSVNPTSPKGKKVIRAEIKVCAS